MGEDGSEWDIGRARYKKAILGGFFIGGATRICEIRIKVALEMKNI